MQYECWQCGKMVDFPDGDGKPFWRVFCKDEPCAERYKEQSEKELKEYVALKLTLMHKRALKMIENAPTIPPMHKYKDASEIVLKEALETTDLYQSSHEMACAIVFHANGCKFEAQKPIGKHHVDFYLPDFKVIFEVDGYMHKYRTASDNARDIFIRQELGKDWEIIRIKTGIIEKGPDTVIEDIEKAKKHKQILRLQYGEILPASFTKIYGA